MPDFDLAAQPHDAFFKEWFPDPARAAEIFRAHLPPSLTGVCQWSTLKLVPGSFVKQSLQQAHSDLLFTVTAGSRDVMLYLLFEHQTTVDKAMPLRL